MLVYLIMGHGPGMLNIERGIFRECGVGGVEIRRWKEGGKAGWDNGSRRTITIRLLQPTPNFPNVPQLQTFVRSSIFGDNTPPAQPQASFQLTCTKFHWGGGERIRQDGHQIPSINRTPRASLSHTRQQALTQSIRSAKRHVCLSCQTARPWAGLQTTWSRPMTMAMAMAMVMVSLLPPTIVCILEPLLLACFLAW